MVLHIIFPSLLALALAQNLPSLVHQRFVDEPPPCGKPCQFRFCEERRNLFLTSPGTASSPEICRRGQEIDQILETGEALVSLESGNVPISEWRPEGLDEPFPPDFFTAGEITNRDNSGLMRSNAQGNQNSFLTGNCFILPINRFERIRRKRNNAKRVVPTNAKKRLKDCIAFEPVVFDIYFEVQWFSADDLDLEVIEPNGTLVDFRNPQSTCGRIRAGDQGVSGCETRGENIERIEYSWDCEGLQRGSYTILLRHTTNCLLTNPPKATPFEIRIVINGSVQLRSPGSSNKNDRELITSLVYTI